MRNPRRINHCFLCRTKEHFKYCTTLVPGLVVPVKVIVKLVLPLLPLLTIAVVVYPLYAEGVYHLPEVNKFVEVFLHLRCV